MRTALPILWITVLAIALVIYPAYDYFMARRALDKIGRAYCDEHGFSYVGVKHAKAHLSVIYSAAGKRHYAKFIVHKSLGRVRKVEWLK